MQNLNSKTILRQAINIHYENLSVYNELATMGFGSRELIILLNTILNIANSNGISLWLAVDKFFKDIETQYDAKLGFESEKEDLNLQIQTLKQEREKMMQILRAQPLVGPMVTKLFQLGLSENDILKVAETHLSILSRTYSAEDLAKGMVMTIDTIMMTPTTSHVKATSNNKIIEILSKVRQDLSQLSFAN